MKITQEYQELLLKLDEHYIESYRESGPHTEEKIHDLEKSFGTKFPVILKEFCLKYGFMVIPISRFDLIEVGYFEDHDNYYAFAQVLPESDECEEGVFLLEKSDHEILDSAVFFTEIDSDPEKKFDSMYEWFVSLVGGPKQKIELPEKYKEITEGLAGVGSKSDEWIKSTEKALKAKLPDFLKWILLNHGDIEFDTEDCLEFNSDDILYYAQQDPKLKKYYSIAVNNCSDAYLLKKSRKQSLDSPVYKWVHDDGDDEPQECYKSIYDMFEDLT